MAPAPATKLTKDARQADHAMSELVPDSRYCSVRSRIGQDIQSKVPLLSGAVGRPPLPSPVGNGLRRISAMLPVGFPAALQPRSTRSRFGSSPGPVGSHLVMSTCSANPARLCSAKEAVGITKRLAWPRECISGMPRTPLQHNECHSGIYGPAPPLDNATAAAQLPMMTMQTI